ncbi:MAG TPA: folylpolyglutamate synthase/dihydrofolate synthase family protein [Candidatus Paceibacterota bacterium]|nr:folylpolyglutamate synthase/dihydrofolate synthase family protein [Candidatus Paceibacterota bacterium]
MIYSEAIQFLYSLRLFGAKFGLENTFHLAALAGNPQGKLRFIHVAGTNGKGSTCAMLESIYRAAGLRVGLFTSPHLVSFRERIQVNRQLIPENKVVRLVEELRAVNLENEATLFEFATVMALKFFAEQQCDLVIWETGLGGRLDATNIVTPLASVITNIAFDHQQWLGGTLEKIAAEKAGIIKPGIPVVTTADDLAAFAVFESVAREKNSPLTHIGQDPASSLQHPTSLLGDHQKLNAALALATVEVLQKQIPVPEEKIRAGLATVNWPGRLQWVEKAGGGKILLDGAHNVAGAETLRAALEKDFAGTKPVLIFGALADKNWPAICRLLAPLASKIFTVPVASGRTAEANALADSFRSANPAAAAAACENLSGALIACKDEPFVVITGSLYLVGEALERLGLSPADGGERGLNEWNAPQIPR